MSVQTVSARGSRIGRLLGQFVRFAVVGGSGVVVKVMAWGLFLLFILIRMLS